MDPQVIILDFKRYLKDSVINPIKIARFSKIPIDNIDDYISLLMDDAYLNNHNINETNLIKTSDELFLKVNPLNLNSGDITSRFYLEIGHVKKEGEIYFLDRIFQKAEQPLSQNEKIKTYAMASLMYHHAVHQAFHKKEK